jgi:hypothetical protein
MTRAERIAAWACGLFAAAMRWPALSQTLWDWDEALFALALRDYDVSAYHPHPPGFPLFIAIAKLIPTDAFHALQSIAFLSSLFVFPAMFFLARALRASVPVATAAGLLLAFLPNVWFYGGTALSDVPSMVLVITACALLLRGQLLLGAIVLGIAAGFRPQNLLIGFAPFVAAFLQRRRAAVGAALLTLAIVIASYAGAASLSGGGDAYRDVLAKHEQYIRNTDSFLAPRHPGLIRVADDFFFRPFRAPAINIAMTLLALVGLRRQRLRFDTPLAIFGPFCLFAWLFLDFHSASRFSIAYMPLLAMLAATGIPERGRPLILGAVVALMIVWTWPALRVVHTTPSPPVAAIESLRTFPGTIYVDERLGAHAELLIPDRTRRTVRTLAPLVEDPNAALLREDATPAGENFTRGRDRLASIARPRYFEVSVIPGRRPGVVSR